MQWIGLAALAFAAIAVSGVESQNVFCYYTSWPQYRPDPAKFFPSNIDVNLCNYAVFAFAFLKNNELVTHEWNDITMYGDMNALKQQNPQLKTLLAVGGWTMDMYDASLMMATPQNRSAFISQSYDFINTHGFDGLDLDFEYPASRESADKPEDRENFSALVKELKEYYTTGGRSKLVTAAVGAGKDTVEKGYEINEICQHLDFINIMTYDFNGAWDSVTGINSPLCPTAADYDAGDKAYWNVQSASYIWANCGCPKEKMNIGMPTYGRSFTLESNASRGIGAPATGAAVEGKYTGEPGFHSYYEICSLIRGTDGVKVADLHQNFDSTIKCPYITYQDTAVGDYMFIGYDNQESLGMKISWVKGQGFGGFMVWSYDLDDFSGNANWCGGSPYPLISHMKGEWASPSYTAAQTACGCSLPAPGVPNSCGDPPPALPVPPVVTCAGGTGGSLSSTTASSTSTTPSTTTLSSDCNTGKTGVVGRCEEYTCDSQQHRCQAGQRFDSVSRACTAIRSAATCQGGSPQIPAGMCTGNTGQFNLENHCTFYVSCEFDIGTLLSCADTLVFSQTTGACVFPADGEGICKG